MKKVTQLASCLTTVLSLTCIATTHAATSRAINTHSSGVYLQGSAGINHLQDQHFSSTRPIGNITVGGEIDYEWGWNGGAEIGLKYGPSRIGIAIYYLNNDMDSISGLPDTHPNGDKTIAINYMLNFTHDIYSGKQWVIYAGLGIGAISVKTDFGALGDHTDTVFAYQNMLGARYPLHNNTDIFAEFRHIGSSSIDLNSNSTHGTLQSYYQNNVLNVGINYLF